MGAAEYYETVEGQNADSAYRKIKDLRGTMRGYSYSGTIANSEGYTVLPISPVTVEQAYEIARENIEAGEVFKGGPAYAIRVVEHTPAVFGESQKVEVDFKVKADEDGALDYYPIRAIAKHLKVDEDTIPSCFVKKTPVKVRVVAKGTDGARETRHFAVKCGSTDMPAWDSGFSSQAEARTHIATLAANDLIDTEYEVFSMTRRVGGAGLVEARSQITYLSIKGTATVRPVVEPAKDGTTHWGWLFFGVAPC